MSHELRTPLNSIIGFIGIILMGLSGPLTDTQRKQAEHVRKAAEHLLSLINDILDLAKVESGNLRVEFAPVNARTILSEMIALLQPQADARNLYLKVLPYEGPEVIAGDERSLRQIFANLISNAVKFTDSGGITVNLSAQDGYLHLAV